MSEVSKTYRNKSGELLKIIYDEDASNPLSNADRAWGERAERIDMPFPTVHALKQQSRVKRDCRKTKQRERAR